MFCSFENITEWNFSGVPMLVCRPHLHSGGSMCCIWHGGWARKCLWQIRRVVLWLIRKCYMLGMGRQTQLLYNLSKTPLPIDLFNFTAVPIKFTGGTPDCCCEPKKGQAFSKKNMQCLKIRWHLYLSLEILLFSSAFLGSPCTLSHIKLGHITINTKSRILIISFAWLMYFPCVWQWRTASASY